MTGNEFTADRRSGVDRNPLWGMSGPYLLTAAIALPVLAWGVPPTGELLLIVVGALLAIIGLNYATTTLRYTDREIVQTRALDLFSRNKPKPVRLDRLTSVTYWDRRDLELRLEDSDGNVVYIDVSTRWRGVGEWGPLIQAAAFRANIPLDKRINEILIRGHGRWLPVADSE
ncbi:MAG TPA: hypothetical protein VFC82_02365 [Actinomycetaceae bacterium]|nr:hypothetical protein [Actinomycetaceae bacterium]